VYGGLVDFSQSSATSFIQGGGARFVEQSFDHRADAHHLGGLADVVSIFVVARLATLAWREHFIRVHGHVVVFWICHYSSVPDNRGLRARPVGDALAMDRMAP